MESCSCLQTSIGCAIFHHSEVRQIVTQGSMSRVRAINNKPNEFQHHVTPSSLSPSPSAQIKPIRLFTQTSDYGHSTCSVAEEHFMGKTQAEILRVILYQLMHVGRRLLTTSQVHVVTDSFAPYGVSCCCMPEHISDQVLEDLVHMAF